MTFFEMNFFEILATFGPQKKISAAFTIKGTTEFRNRHFVISGPSEPPRPPPAPPTPTKITRSLLYPSLTDTVLPCSLVALPPAHPPLQTPLERAGYARGTTRHAALDGSLGRARGALAPPRAGRTPPPIPSNCPTTSHLRSVWSLHTHPSANIVTRGSPIPDTQGSWAGMVFTVRLRGCRLLRKHWMFLRTGSKATTFIPLRAAWSESYESVRCVWVLGLQPDYAPTMRPLCALYAPTIAPPMRPLCALYAPSMRPLLRPLCAPYAPSMRPLCAHYAPSMAQPPSITRQAARTPQGWRKLELRKGAL